MESSSRILVAPGLRTPARLDWRTGFATALAIVSGSSRLWILGMVGLASNGINVLLILFEGTYIFFIRTGHA